MSKMVYLARAEGAPSATTINRIGGSPIGIAPASWPKFKNKPMTHLITVDLKTVPLGYRPANRAISVFCANPDGNHASDPATRETKVILIPPKDIPRGETAPPKNAPVLEPAKLIVQKKAWRKDCYFGGDPAWLQGEPACFEPGGEDPPYSFIFVMQFSEHLVPMNLGDAGVMYVCTNGAFWQCC